MEFDVFTLLPEVFLPYLNSSILHRARQRGLIDVRIHNIRDWAADKHHVTDDEPYGGGGGMVMKVEPVFAAVESVLGPFPCGDDIDRLTPSRCPTGRATPEACCPVILLTPQGRVFSQKIAMELVQHPRLALICGRYEGVDERIREHLVTDEISIGDYVLTGGELPALILIDAISRLIPGVLGDPDGAMDDSHAAGLLEYPHYTRPPEYRGWGVPEILLSGDHAKIEKWRREQSLRRTLKRRLDLLESAPLSETDRKVLKKIQEEGENS
ncbi:MAG: tRNA (guanosine(37)-N1)-methyltransferase TrmD [Anaerolineales bacterium]